MIVSYIATKKVILEIHYYLPYVQRPLINNSVLTLIVLLFMLVRSRPAIDGTILTLLLACHMFIVLADFTCSEVTIPAGWISNDI